MDATFDQNGDIDRQGFLVEIVDGKQVIKQVLPKLELRLKKYDPHPEERARRVSKDDGTHDSSFETRPTGRSSG